MSTAQRPREQAKPGIGSTVAAAYAAGCSVVAALLQELHVPTIVHITRVPADAYTADAEPPAKTVTMVVPVTAVNVTVRRSAVRPVNAAVGIVMALLAPDAYAVALTDKIDENKAVPVDVPSEVG